MESCYNSSVRRNSTEFLHSYVIDELLGALPSLSVFPERTIAISGSYESHIVFDLLTKRSIVAYLINTGNTALNTSRSNRINWTRPARWFHLFRSENCPSAIYGFLKPSDPWVDLKIIASFTTVFMTSTSWGSHALLFSSCAFFILSVSDLLTVQYLLPWSSVKYFTYWT